LAAGVRAGEGFVWPLNVTLLQLAVVATTVRAPVRARVEVALPAAGAGPLLVLVMLFILVHTPLLLLVFLGGLYY
jgi:hypothetical protein